MNRVIYWVGVLMFVVSLVVLPILLRVNGVREISLPMFIMLWMMVWSRLMFLFGVPIIFISAPFVLYARLVAGVRLLELLMRGASTPEMLVNLYRDRWKRKLRVSTAIELLTIGVGNGRVKTDLLEINPCTVLNLTPDGVRYVQEQRRAGFAGLKIEL